MEAEQGAPPHRIESGCGHLRERLLRVHAVAMVTQVPIKVNHGQAIFAFTISPEGKRWFHSKRLTKTITINEVIIPTINGSVFPLRQRRARSNPPRSAPLVRPRREKAALRTY